LKATSDLTDTEEAELRILQDEAYQRTKAKHALPFSTPEALETLIREHKEIEEEILLGMQIEKETLHKYIHKTHPFTNL
jgi:hypothetical protein